MANTIFELSAVLGLDSKEFEQELQDAEKQTERSGKNIGASLKNAAAVGAKAFATLATAAAAGVAALATSAVKSYAEYEQLVGGVDTLFKDASQRLQDYANQAYMTAGMSANDYMANATAFSASLISSLGGDTKKAADYANRAMVSMSDNANKMGTSIDSIVQTYQSLSRGNFAMLDNLKLGYGGTKEELQRLIKDAASYTDIQKEMGVTVDKSSTSFANIVNAIAVVQGKLGIAGATAQEAATTIEGSINSAKAAWKNLVVAMADDTQDFGKLVNNLVVTLVGDGSGNGGLINNILPRFSKALSGVGRLIERLAPIIIEQVPGIVNDIFPTILSAAGQIIEKLIVAIPQLIEGILPTAVSAVGDIVVAILEALPGFVDAIANVLPTIIDQIGKLFTEKNIADKFAKAVARLITVIANNIKPITDAFVSVLPQITESLNNALKDNIGDIIAAVIDLLLELTRNAPAIFGALSSQIGPVVETIVGVLVENIDEIIAGVITLLTEITARSGEIVVGVLANLFEGSVNAFDSFFKSLFSGEYDDDFSNLGSALTSEPHKFEKLPSNYNVSQSAAGDYFGESAIVVEIPETNSIGEVNIVIEGPVEDPMKTGKTIAEQIQEMMERRGAANASY